jgi:hypothetical protein
MPYRTAAPTRLTLATSPTEIAVSGSPQTTTWPSAISRSRALASSRRDRPSTPQG